MKKKTERGRTEGRQRRNDKNEKKDGLKERRRMKGEREGGG